MATRDVAVVTGGASGFGLALAQHCAARGMDIALLDLDEARVVSAAASLEAAYPVRVLGSRVDVASTQDVEGAAQATREHFGRADLLFANVGVQHFGAVESIADDAWRWVFDVNVIGAARTARAFLPLLREHGGGRLAFTASANALAPAARLGAYQASKYAVVGLAETLRIECAEEPVQISVIYPSGMITRHLESSAAARPSEIVGGDVSDADLDAMRASRPFTEADLASAEDAAARALEGVLAGERHIITHGAMDAAVGETHAEIRKALERVASRQGSASPAPGTP
jgi:NAD(P)-dependent dehydrogenase (short-subunit alcohol dehydrogenase family)